MKIRKNILEGWNKKYISMKIRKKSIILVAVPDMEWSYSFSYEEDQIQIKLLHSLKEKVSEENAKNIK